MSQTRALTWILLGTLVAIAVISLAAWGGRQQDTGGVLLVTGKEITPQGQQVEVGSFPANMAVSGDSKWIAVTNTGYREYLSILSTADGHLVSQLAFNEDLPGGSKAKQALYVGLAFAPGANGSQILYASRGSEDRVSLFNVDAQGQLTDTGRALKDLSSVPKQAGGNYVAGIAVNGDGTRCYAVNNESSAYTQQKGSISILDIAADRVLGAVTTPGFPFAIAALTKGPEADKKVYVTSERYGVVSVLDVQDPSAGKLLRDIPTGDHPMALLLDRAQKRLFVANAGSDTLSVIDTAGDRVIRTIPVRPAEARGLPGATPTGMAFSPDESRLYVSLGDMNAVAVVDMRKNALAGYIPAGWYPTAVVVSPDGAHLFVANAKGVQARNPNKVSQGPRGEWGQYIENIIEGTVSVMAVPTDEALKGLTARVMINNRIRPNLAESNRSALPRTGIKHVLYIIKENRTYDQVLGDMPQGNGDASIVLFGRNVTPNQHALAERFVLLDNFYDCAETSGDGWDWSTSGMASEYTIRNLPVNYGGRGRSYDFEGQNNGTPADMEGLPDVARAPAGYIWDNCARHGLTYRNYGCYNAFRAEGPPGEKPIALDNAPTKKALSGVHNDENYFRFDMAYADSEAWQILNCPSPNQRKAYGKFNAPSRFSEWKREFDGFVQNDNFPQFQIVRLPRDHTQGTTPGQHSPRAMAADNDYAVGQFVEAVSKSKYWNETAIFILEDDAQNGHDHVDAHRSTCYVISPHVKRATVDHHFYNTDSALRTMQALLGLPPMCQYDAVAPILDVFDPRPVNAEPYAAVLPAREIVGEVNGNTAYRARDSQRLDFTREDRVPDAVLNDILWHSIKGANTPEPAARQGLQLRAGSKRDAD